MQPTLTIPTKTKTKSANWRPQRRTGSPPENPPLPPSPTTPIENIAEFFASRGKKVHRAENGSRRAHRQARFSVPAKKFAIPNMEKEPSTSAKEKAKKPRLLYNFLASA